MFKNYLTLTLRNLLKFKVYSIITISGLAIALASCFLIYSYVLDELSFDRYHEKAVQIYRVVYGQDKIATATPYILAPTLMNDFPEIIKSVRVSPITPILIKKVDNWIPENEFICADKNFFNMYTLPLIKGDPQNVLAEPFSVVITKEIAQKFYGDQDASGKILSIQIDKEIYDLKITGLLDHFPRNSHFRADLIASMAVEEKIFSKLEKRMSIQFGSQISLLNSWDASSFFTYLLLPQNHNTLEWDKKFDEFEKRHFSGTRAFNFKLQSLTDIHLHTPGDEQGNIRYLYLFSAIALFILLVACVNFIILSTAHFF